MLVINTLFVKRLKKFRPKNENHIIKIPRVLFFFIFINILYLILD